MFPNLVFEARDPGTKEWFEMPDEEFMDNLYITYRRVSTAIREMLREGKIITINGRDFRIRER
jgi:hypothetical protein